MASQSPKASNPWLERCRVALGQDRAIPIRYAMLRALNGDYDACVVLTVLLYHTDKTRGEDGWIYRSYKRWEEEEMLSEYRIEKAVKTLMGRGLIERRRGQIRGAGTPWFYRIEPVEFCRWLGLVLGKPLAYAVPETAKTPVSEAPKSETGKTPVSTPSETAESAVTYQQKLRLHETGIETGKTPVSFMSTVVPPGVRVNSIETVNPIANAEVQAPGSTPNPSEGTEETESVRSILMARFGCEARRMNGTNGGAG